MCGAAERVVLVAGAGYGEVDNTSAGRSRPAGGAARPSRDAAYPAGAAAAPPPERAPHTGQINVVSIATVPDALCPCLCSCVALILL